MMCYKIMTYIEGSHESPFYILVEDDVALLRALDVIKASSEVDSFEVDNGNGNTFYNEVFTRVYPGIELPKQNNGE